VLECGLVSVGILITLILIGAPIGVAMGLGAVVGLWILSGDFSGATLGLLGTTCYSTVCDYTFTVIPMFVLMGVIVEVSGQGRELYALAAALFRRLRGGLAIATVLANTVFAAITGVSVASAALFSKIALPEMVRAGYSKELSLGAVAGSAALGMIIPPSVLMIIYAMLAEQSIGHLFIAGIIPGLLIAAIFCLGIVVWCKLRPGYSRMSEGMSSTHVLRLAAPCWGIIPLIGLVLGGIYMGVLTPTEAGAAGATLAILISLSKRRLSFSLFRKALLETGLITTGLLFLLIAAQMYARVLGLSGLLRATGELVLSLDISPMVVIVLFVLILLLAGLFLDCGSILLLTMPLMVPIVRHLGFDLIWFGLVTIVASEIGMYTPPFGMIVYTMKGVLGDQVTVQQIFIGSVPFTVMMAGGLALLIAFPALCLWLPSTML